MALIDTPGQEGGPSRVPLHEVGAPQLVELDEWRRSDC